MKSYKHPDIKNQQEKKIRRKRKQKENTKFNLSRQNTQEEALRTVLWVAFHGGEDAGAPGATAANPRGSAQHPSQPEQRRERKKDGAKSCPTRVTPWTGARQAPLSVGFSRQGHWSGLPFPSPGELPDPGIEPRSSALRGQPTPRDQLPRPPRQSVTEPTKGSLAWDPSSARAHDVSSQDITPAPQVQP